MTRAIMRAYRHTPGDFLYPMTSLLIRSLLPEDRAWIEQFLTDRWHDTFMITKGEVHYPAQEQGFIAEMDHSIVGLVTFRVQDHECEILSLDSLRQGAGIGTALLEAVVNKARDSIWLRVWLITTNDNLNALGFYQKRGFHLAAVYPDAVRLARLSKPSIPLMGENEIPLRDEIELEMQIQARTREP